ncbi:MAG: sulfurtransferase [Candidatus Nanopelagicales bacterium]
MDERTIVSAAWLRDHLDDPHLVILDSRFSLDDEEWGERTYLEGHIPGAMYANTATHLAGEIIPGVTGRRPFPEPSVFAEQLGAWGISDSTQVVTYDADGGRMSAARVWLMLRWMGHDRVAVLDGGWQAWLAQDGEVTTDVPTPAPTTYPMRLRPELLADVDEVDRHRQHARTCVFDSRGAEGYHGGGVYHDPVRGHIAGAGLADRANTTNSDLTFRSPSELRAYYLELLDGVDPEEVIYYCGSGITAAQNVLGMHIAGLEGSRMYVGSWSEWITDPSRPVEL